MIRAAGACEAEVAKHARTLRLLVCAVLWTVFGVPPGFTEERPSPVARYRYVVPNDLPSGSPGQQGAYSYRNQLSSERLRLDRDMSRSQDGATRLRRQGELNREIDRVDRLLNR
jgi:hypothetical protein